MKKLFYMALLSLGMVGCASDDSNVTSNLTLPEDLVSLKEIDLGGGTLAFGKSNVKTTPVAVADASRTTVSVTNVPCFGEDSHVAHENIKVEEVTLPDVDVMGLAKMVCAEFPEYGIRGPLKESGILIPHPQLTDFTTDFNYVSNGLPVDLMLVYTGTSSDTKLHIYYYDKDGQFHIQQIWAMDSEWKKSNEKNTFQDFARINQDNKAWRFTLPQGTEFGFMMQGICGSNKSDRRDKVEYHYTRMEENIAHPAKNGFYPKDGNFPSATQFKLENDYKGTFKGKEYTLEASKLKGKTFVTFNNQFDKDLTDYDYNDMILMVTPTPDVKDYETPDVNIEIGEPIDVDFICESDDTNIRLHSAITDEMIAVSKVDNIFGLILKAGERFKVNIKDLDKLEQYWTSYPGDKVEELVADIWLYVNYDSEVTIDQIKQLFGVPADAKMIKEAYNVTHEGVLNENYWYNVDLAVIPGTDAAHPHRVHISPIIYRNKQAAEAE